MGKGVYDTYIEGERLPNYRSLSGIDYKEYYEKTDWDGELPAPGDFLTPAASIGTCTGVASGHGGSRAASGRRRRATSE
jgi:hypothetical protein